MNAFVDTHTCNSKTRKTFSYDQQNRCYGVTFDKAQNYDDCGLWSKPFRNMWKVLILLNVCFWVTSSVFKDHILYFRLRSINHLDLHVSHLPMQMESFRPTVVDIFSFFISSSIRTPPNIINTAIKTGGKDVKNPI